MNTNFYKNLLITVLLVVVFLLPFLSMRNFSPVADEITHLPSGYSYLVTGEIKLNPQHPPLIKMLAAFPLLFLNLKLNSNDPNLIGHQVNEWQFGRDFLSSNRVDRVIFWGRIPMILLSVLLGWYIFKWGKDLFGYMAGLAGLFIYAFMPNIIAHAQLVTTDLGVTAFSFIALYYLWKLTKDPNKRNLILSGLSLGLALGSKFLAVFLLPIFFILSLVYVRQKYAGSSWLTKIKSFLKIILPIYGLTFLVIWGLYFFTSDVLFYWKGLNTVYVDGNIGFPYYLNGDFKPGGWWYYFLEAFIIKTPIPFLATLLVALAYYKKSSLSFLNISFIFLPVILFLFTASWKAHNIGVRYILSIYPFLILFVSGYLLKIFNSANSKIKATLILLLVGWYVYSSVSIYPDYLSYFNELVGGSSNGYKYLDDSNIDWGQDLKRLAEYQKNNPDLRVVYVWDSYVDAARLYGIQNMVSLDSQELWLNPSGKYAVSTHAVIRTKLLSRVNENNKLNWMDHYKPVDRIGQSFFIYNFK